MFRFFLIALIAIFAVLVNPSLRERVIPYLQPVLDPGYEMIARARLSDVVYHLEQQRESGRSLPTAETLQEFLRNRYATRDAVTDPWGTPYFLSSRRNAVTVASAGRDRQPGTADDIVSETVPTQRR